MLRDNVYLDFKLGKKDDQTGLRQVIMAREDAGNVKDTKFDIGYGNYLYNVLAFLVNPQGRKACSLPAKMTDQLPEYQTYADNLFSLIGIIYMRVVRDLPADGVYLDDEELAKLKEVIAKDDDVKEYLVNLMLNILADISGSLSQSLDLLVTKDGLVSKNVLILKPYALVDLLAKDILESGALSKLTLGDAKAEANGGVLDDADTGELNIKGSRDVLAYLITLVLESLTSLTGLNIVVDFPFGAKGEDAGLHVTGGMTRSQYQVAMAILSTINNEVGYSDNALM